ncbi:shootin-1-like isoform X2 [Physella acuta]|uniref:shootin-1-like isoform X2 n=1 Tax=Physella acuta TaxID=109671 RepID=UPI0027DE6C7B|nr:shootin-1-like isoform X2 [Physella acuta]
MPSDNPEDVECWQKKCAELENIIKTLSTHCIKVVEKHEELLVNYKKNQDQYNIIVQKLKEKGDQIKKAKDVLGPVTQEYEALREKYEIAVRCQYEAENFASKVNNKNKVLKRQSQMLLDKVSGLNVVEMNFEDETDNVEENEYIKKLDQQIEDLEDQKSSLSVELKVLKEDYEIERSANEKLREQVESLRGELSHAKKNLVMQEKTLQQLAKTSEAAYSEYQSLQDQFEKEITSRTTVEKLAHSLYAEREAARRQSAMLMKDIGNQHKLMEALIQVEELTTTMETIKADLNYKIQLLESELQSQKESSGQTSLEEENNNLIQERDLLQQRLEETEKLCEQQRSQYDMMMKKYAELENKYNYAVAPPPPPPPPPPPMSKAGGFLSKITGGGRKKQRELAQKRRGAPVNADYNKAVEEMMKRIQQGNIGLRPVLKKRTAQETTSLQSCPEEDEGSAMKELQGILTKMKKSRSEEDLLVFDTPTVDEKSELGQAFLKIQAKQSAPGSDKPRPAPRKLSVIKDEEEQ